MVAKVHDTYGAGLATLDSWIADLRATSAKLKAAYPVVAERIKAEIDAAISEGRSVDGQQWQPKKEGGKALVHAAAALTAKAIGNVIVIALRGPEVFHNFGTKRVPRRAILPMGGIPDRLGNAIRLGLVDMGPEWMRRAGRHDRGSGGVKMNPRAVVK